MVTIFRCDDKAHTFLNLVMSFLHFLIHPSKPITYITSSDPSLEHPWRKNHTFHLLTKSLSLLSLNNMLHLILRSCKYDCFLKLNYKKCIFLPSSMNFQFQTKVEFSTNSSYHLSEWIHSVQHSQHISRSIQVI